MVWLLLQLSEIAIPHLLAASIFSAQNGGAVFYRNAKLLVVLCLVSGVFRFVIFCSYCLWYKTTHNLLFNSHVCSQSMEVADHGLYCLSQ
jgi:hypothetical protein